MTIERGRCRGVIRTAIIVNGARGRKYLRVFFTGAGNEPAIIVPEGVAFDLYNMAKKPEQKPLYRGQDMMVYHGRVIAKWLQRRTAVVQVTHYPTSPNHTWTYNLIGVE